MSGIELPRVPAPGNRWSAKRRSSRQRSGWAAKCSANRCPAHQHPPTRRSARQHPATRCSARQHPATRCSANQRSDSQCSAHCYPARRWPAHQQHLAPGPPAHSQSANRYSESRRSAHHCQAHQHQKAWRSANQCWVLHCQAHQHSAHQHPASRRQAHQHWAYQHSAHHYQADRHRPVSKSGWGRTCRFDPAWCCEHPAARSPRCRPWCPVRRRSHGCQACCHRHRRQRRAHPEHRRSCCRRWRCFHRRYPYPSLPRTTAVCHHRADTTAVCRRHRPAEQDRPTCRQTRSRP
ncbi:hypothetical protein C8D88_10820 [Lentzea atacamensis]|uniref:Uncharacterized protein n=1 Tax=Lentzea atacamensis TaxID=531938 RepID=A0A316I1X7_9PSEU|nr:hypothetical protein C8D88_10820 [Lentzea atacamensis]